MPANLEQPAHHHVIPLGAAHLDAGHLHAADGELPAKLIDAQLDVDVLAKP